MTAQQFLAILTVGASTVTTAFIAPATFVTRDASSLRSLPDIASFLLAADEEILSMSTDPAVSAVTEAVGEIQKSDGGIVDTITTILGGFTAVAFFLFGLTYVLAAWIIPQAAAQLEQQTKDLDPSLWAEYEAKLAPGETMDRRPDLMQELGDKVQKLMTEKFEEESRKQEGGGTVESDQVPTQTPDPVVEQSASPSAEQEVEMMDPELVKKFKTIADASKVLDAEIVTEEEEPKQKTIRISREDDPWSE
jgi:hypothetical protein